MICPDLPGRGRSSWLAKADDYALPQYCADMNALIARLGVREVDWVGTSLGGMIGMIMAGFSGSIVRKLVINDIGPFVTSSGLHRIGQYIGSMPPSFATLDDAEGYLRTVLAPYGRLADEHWRHLARHSVRWNEERACYVMLCDPAIAKAFKSTWFYPLNLWSYWEAIKAPVLVLHGAHSDLLSFDLTQEMKKRNRLASVFSFDDCGYVPPLMAADQIDVVTRFCSGIDGSFSCSPGQPAGPREARPDDRLRDTRISLAMSPAYRFAHSGYMGITPAMRSSGRSRRRRWSTGGGRRSPAPR